MEVNKSKPILIGFIVFIVICLNFFLLNVVTEGSANKKTFEKNIEFLK